MPRKASRRAKSEQPRPNTANGEATTREEAGNIGTPYDDVFKTMAVYLASLFLPVLNKLFGAHYTGKEKVQHRNNEHFVTRPDGTQQKRMTDSYFVVFGENCRAYVIECQTNPDGSILIRIFEYTLQVALENARLEKDALWVDFPEAALIALRSTENTSKEMTVHVAFPNGAAVSYAIPVLRVKDYTLDEIFEEDLLFILPFYIFTHEARFPEYEEDEGKLRLLQEDFATIIRRLNERVEQGKLSEYESNVIIEMAGKVADNLAAKYTNVRKGVRKVVGGTPFVPQTEIMYREALAKGMREGMREGRREGMREGMREGRREGMREGELKMLFSLVDDGLIPIEAALAKADMSRDEFVEQMSRRRMEG